MKKNHTGATAKALLLVAGATIIVTVAYQMNQSAPIVKTNNSTETNPLASAEIAAGQPLETSAIAIEVLVSDEGTPLNAPTTSTSHIEVLPAETLTAVAFPTETPPPPQFNTPPCRC